MKKEVVTGTDVKQVMMNIYAWQKTTMGRNLDTMDAQRMELEEELKRGNAVRDDQTRIIKELRKRLDCSVSADDYEKKFLSVQYENTTLKKQIELLNEAAIKQACDALYKNDVIKAADKAIEAIKKHVNTVTGRDITHDETLGKVAEEAVSHFNQMKAW